MKRSLQFFDHPGPLAFAHRGGAAEAPENTWCAFERSAALGYRYMETDIRTTADGVAVAFHDPGLERVAHRPGLLAQTTWASLRQVNLDDGRPVPRLEELLEAWPDMRWNIDVKTGSAIAPVAEALRRAGAKDRALVASFSGLRTARVKRLLGPGLATGTGRFSIGALMVAKHAPFLAGSLRSLPAAAQVPLARWGIAVLDEKFLRACHRAGTAVHAWTIDEPDEVRRLLDLGVDGIMTDRPSVVKDVLVERGQWHNR